METIAYSEWHKQVGRDAFKAAHLVMAEHILRHKDKPYDPLICSSVIAGTVKALVSITEAVGSGTADDMYRVLCDQVAVALNERFPGWTPTPKP